MLIELVERELAGFGGGLCDLWWGFGWQGYRDGFEIEISKFLDNFARRLTDFFWIDIFVFSQTDQCDPWGGYCPSGIEQPRSVCVRL